MMQKNARTRQLVLTSAIAGMILFAAGARAFGNAAYPENPGRSDVILINAMTTFGPIERPPVAFLHDKHTAAVERSGKDCLACHLQDDASDRLSIKYMRLGDTDRQVVMDTYHSGCVGCHNEQLSAGKTSGPIVCAGCHAMETNTVSNRQPFGMDKSLHLRHLKATGVCGKCHHVYDEAEKKLVHKPGEDSTCRYCHPDKAEENRTSMREASHVSCVGCHRSLTVQSDPAGPLECAGCHDPEHQADIEKLARVPRIKTGQPDVVFVNVQAPESRDAKVVRMNPVPFDHKAHETYNDTCRVCHHASLTGCVDCHTVSGGKEGSFVNLEQAMHRSGTDASCIGCHEQEQMDSACAGCHGFMSKTRQMPQTYCNTCHSTPPVGSIAIESDQTAAPSAAEILEARKSTSDTYDRVDIPEKVTIQVLSETYAPVELPHGKIVSALVKGMESNTLARYFHTEEGTLCQGCHHNSPASKKPPRCASCHGKPFQEGALFRPGLMAAYHQQCMGCHDQMGIEKPASRDCTGCHEEK